MYPTQDIKYQYPLWSHVYFELLKIRKKNTLISCRFAYFIVKFSVYILRFIVTNLYKYIDNQISLFVAT